MSYRESHKDIDKGISYDSFYRNHLWEKYLWEREQFILGKILKDFYQDSNIKLLDFACGTGRITSFLEDKVQESIGIDVSHSMLAIAKEKLASTKLIEHDLTQSNIFEDKKFNLITAFRFFLNAENDLRENALKVISSILSEDGYFVFNNHGNWSSPSIKLKYLYSKLRRIRPTNVLSIKEINLLLNEYNLEIITIYPVGFINPIKIDFPVNWNHNLDSLITKLNYFSRFSESPILVAKLKK